MKIECIRFKKILRGSLLGMADFVLENMGICLYGCSLHTKNGARWVNLPSKEYKDKDGNIKYAPVIRFISKDHANLFSEECKKAIDRYIQANPQPDSNIEEDIPF